jgi:hypothetical protein
MKQMGKQVAYYGGSPVQDEKTGEVTSTQVMAKTSDAKAVKVNKSSKNTGNVAL